MNENIIIKGAREHNLKNISLSIPRNKLIVITGLSGSGKSTLAFDTIYAEGQRRYVESLSAYARQFLSLMNKPDVDSIDGLSPAISIEQKTTSKNPRSTVGTVTEIYDYLRLLFARVGTPHCPIHKCVIQRQSPTKITDQIIEQFNSKKVDVFAPVIRQKKGTYEQLFSDLHKSGYTNVRVNNKLHKSNETITLDRYKKHNIDVLINTTTINKEDSDLIQEAVESSLSLADGLVIISNSKKDTLFSEKMACSKCGFVFEELQPRIFSFNTPFGACKACHGLGFRQDVDPNLVIPDKSLCIADGAIAAYRNAVDGWRGQILTSVGKNYGFDALTPISLFSKKQLNILLYGAKDKIKFQISSKSSEAAYHYDGSWEGLIPQLERLYHSTESDYRRKEIEKFMRISPCQDCKGKRLQDHILSILIDGKSIIDITDLSVEKSLYFFKNLSFPKDKAIIAKQVLKEIIDRLSFLKNVGLGYLNLSRSAGTLSGGEAQRIRLATQIGSNLTGVLYVLDEPSIGLHQRDNNRLIKTLKSLRDLGNTLIVVEHDEDTIKNADEVIDIGPKAGIHGGKVIFQGAPKDILSSEKSLTGKYMSGKKSISYLKKRRIPKGWFSIKNASENNLKNIDVNFPKGVMTFVTGVSGSGKSTLVHQILYKSLMRSIHGSNVVPGKHDSLWGFDDFEKVIIIDQSPIGKTPRSNPATYTKLFDEIRSLFSMIGEAKLRGYKPCRFSFNVKGGRCEKCAGDGLIKIEMNFLPDVYVECDECKGTRYNRETLEVYYKGKNISDVLNMSVEESLEFFKSIPSINRKLQTLFDVGLGYIKLGQSSTTLSGGESQRIKLTRELAKRSTKKTLYILDEPTTGLHFHDVHNLLKVLNKLVNNGSSMIIIEHNLDMIKNADYIIDLGPEGGDKGGFIVASGTPEEIVNCKNSHTGLFLKKVLK